MCEYQCFFLFPRTFEEDKFAVRSLVGGVDARRQALPELIDLHGITFLHLVVPQTPKPAVLQHSELKQVKNPMSLDTVIQNLPTSKLQLQQHY